MRSSDQEFNRLRVLKALRRAGPICRTDLAQMTDLTGGTITEISGGLLDRGLVLEERVASGRRGRPRVDLRINPEGAYALGAFMSVDGMMTCEIVNMQGGSEYAFTCRMPPVHGLDEWGAAIAATIDAAIVASPFPRKAIRMVGVGLPAMVDASTGTVHWLQTFELVPFPIAAVIEAVVRVPVTIDNDINMLARAEHWFGEGAMLDDFTLVGLGLGISAGHYAKGLLVAGANGLNSELGHAKIVPEGGLRCGCGAAGCLTAYSSMSGLVEAVCAVEGRDLPSFLDVFERFEDFAEEARQGHAAIRAVFDRGGRYLGVAMANLINASDPGRILLLTESDSLTEMLSDAFYRALDENVLPAARGKTVIEFRRRTESMNREGAAAMVLEQVYRIR